MPTWLEAGLGKSQPQVWDLGECREGTAVLEELHLLNGQARARLETKLKTRKLQSWYHKIGCRGSKQDLAGVREGENWSRQEKDQTCEHNCR